MRSQILKRTIVAVVLVAVGVFAFLLATGERGFSARERPERSLNVARLDPTATKRLGWSSDGLSAVFSYAATLSSDTLVIATDGEVVASFGDLSERRQTHSMRKALLSALVVRRLGDAPRQISLDATLEELGIDDAPQTLSNVQKQTTVRHLLKSVSGVNHPAAAELGQTAEKSRLLGADENTPGAKWAYNNWDYNVLTTVFEMRTGASLADAFRDDIAIPLGMKDFSTADVIYRTAPERSQHRAAAFQMSARDLVKFGRLYLDRGKFGEEQIIPASWVDRITSDFTKTGRDDLRWGHGYLWWLPNPELGLPDGAFWAWGLGNQALFVIPAWKTVIVHQSDTREFLKRLLPMLKAGSSAEAALEKLIIACIERGNRDSAYCVEDRFTTRREFEKLIALIVDARQ